jgi:integrase
VLPLADSEARKLGLLIDWKAPEARPVLLECLKAYRAARTAIVERDEGNDIETPPVPVRVPPVATLKLRQVYERWKARKTRSADSVNACGRALALYEEQTGNPPLRELTRSQGDAFCAWLQQQGTSSKTARDRLTWVKSLLKYATHDLEAIGKNPWERLDIAAVTENRRRPWTADELKKFFGQPLFTRYELPDASKGGGAAAYWIPLLGLLHGARVGELDKLMMKDIETLGSIPVMHITDEGEAQKVKTAAGRRAIPLHPELIRLGFLDYVATVRESGAVRLWPALSLRKDKPGGFFSAWFGDTKRALGFGRHPDFHCFRHTVRTQLAAEEASESVIEPPREFWRLFGLSQATTVAV